MSYDEDTHEYVCDHCGRRFPDHYPATPDWRGRMYGKKQYLRLAARNNFKRHVKACRRKHEVEQGDQGAARKGRRSS